MQKFRSHRVSPLSAGASLLALVLTASPALAQDQASAEEDSAGLKEITVTARKVEENLQDVPVAVTALSGDELEQRAVIRVQDIGRFTPGMLTRPGSSTPSALTISLRGQVQSDVLISLDPSVGTYVDGVYWARAYGLNADLLDIQSVQVLKGPQGTLFGRNTTGGAMLINSNNPDLDKLGGRLSLTYGRFNEMQATGVVNIPIVPGKVALRVAGQRFKRDGYITNAVGPAAVSVIQANNPAVARAPYSGAPNGVKLDNRDRWNFRAKLDIKPTDNLTLRFSGEYFKMDEVSPSRQLLLLTSPFTANNPTYNRAGTAALFVGVTNGGPAPVSAAAVGTNIGLGLSLANPIIADLAANPDKAALNEVPYAFAKTQTLGFTGILDTSFGQVQLITGYRKIEAFAGLDLDGSPFPIHYTEGQQEMKQYSGELQFTGKAFGDSLDFATGIFAFHEKGFDQSISIVVPALNPQTSHFYGIIDNDSMGLYAQGTWHFNDQFSFTGGLRYSVDDKGIESRNNNFNRTTSTSVCSLFSAPGIVGPEVVGVPECAVRRRDNFSGVSYLAGLEYKPNEDMLIYLKTAKGFRSGGQNLRAPSAVFQLPFRPETAYSHELGFKGEFFDRRVRLNLAVYQTDVKDIQRSTQIPNPTGVGAPATVLGNAGKARFRGMEAELQAVLFDGFTMSLSGAHVDPKYLVYADLSGDRSFEKFDGVAPYMFNVAADYTRDIGSGSLKLHVDYNWTDDAFSGGNAGLEPSAPSSESATVANLLTIKSAGFLNARASLSFNDDMYELAVFGRNLTNNRQLNSPLLVGPVGYIQSSRFEPATYGLTATVKF